MSLFSSPAQKRYGQLIVAALLAKGVTGTMIVAALSDPQPFRWIIIAVWILVFITAWRHAWRAYKRLLQAEEQSRPTQSP